MTKTITGWEARGVPEAEPPKPSARRLFAELQIAVAEVNRIAEQLAMFDLAPHFNLLLRQGVDLNYTAIGFAGMED